MFKPIKINVVILDDTFEPFGEAWRAASVLYCEALTKRIREVFLLSEIEVKTSPDPRACGHWIEGVDEKWIEEPMTDRVIAIDSELWQSLLPIIPEES